MLLLFTFQLKANMVRPNMSFAQDWYKFINRGDKLLLYCHTD